MRIALLVTLGCGFAFACQLPTEWRPLSEGCRAELAEIILYAKVLAIHEEPYASSLFNYLPYQQYERTEDALLYAAEVEVLCDQAWGSMLEVPAGSRLNLTGLGYFSCHSHTVMENNSYIFFLRMDENYNILPHGVNFQDAIFPDTLENKRLFSSLFQFSNCSTGQTVYNFNSDWESQEDSRELVAELERKNKQLRQRVGKLRHSLRKTRRASQHTKKERQELQERLSTEERHAGHHLNAIPPRHRNTHRLNLSIYVRGIIDMSENEDQCASYQVNFIASLTCTMLARHMKMSGVVSGHAKQDDIHMVSFLGWCFGFSNRRYSLKRRGWWEADNIHPYSSLMREHEANITDHLWRSTD
ncbi:Coiled-coil domain-containing protein 3 [Triplophysa tibetana]|uniref:Coiled-coil domain-containing protein 3 n=1 Tax=Triplophysa tibetana TaxID=1572043 RepID=A0A5A9PFT8_9TELE|nr:Coiled-coil domain-containing protein 3 [Triplophysa tibetana]